MAEIDPVAGFRIARPDSDSSEIRIKPRRRGNLLAYGFLSLTVVLPVCAAVTAFIV